MSVRTTPLRRPLPPLTKLTLGALVGSILAFSFEFILLGQIDQEIAIVIAFVLAGCALVATAWRWTPLFGALLIGAITVNNPYLLYNLSDPTNFGFFAATVVNVACSLTAFAGGIGATVQNYRDARRWPRWLGHTLVGLGGIVVGVLLVGGLAAPTLANGSAVSTNGQPAVHMGPGRFAVPSVVVPLGATLRLVNDGSFPHVIANGTWEGSVAKPAREPGAPVADDLRVDQKGEIVELGPFITAATYQFYCPIHPGMNLAVTAQ